jgi:hypothetical protein
MRDDNDKGAQVLGLLMAALSGAIAAVVIIAFAVFAYDHSGGRMDTSAMPVTEVTEGGTDNAAD